MLFTDQDLAGKIVFSEVCASSLTQALYYHTIFYITIISISTLQKKNRIE